MDITLIPLKQCSPETLKLIARLHLSVMPTLLSDLGLPFVEKYFQEAVGEEGAIGMAALEQDGCTPVGYVIGCPRPDLLMGKLKTPFGWFVRQVIQLLVTRPSVLVQLAISGLAIRGQMGNDPGVIEVTYLGISPRARGMGLGEKMMRTFLDACRQAGYRSVVLSVETENRAALAMHIKVGFQVKKTFREGRFERYRMEIIL